MKTLILIILMSHAFTGVENKPVDVSIVDSARNAAVKVWERQQAPINRNEPESYVGVLFEVDYNAGTTTRVAMPNLVFHIPEPKNVKAEVNEDEVEVKPSTE